MEDTLILLKSNKVLSLKALHQMTRDHGCQVSGILTSIILCIDIMAFFSFDNNNNNNNSIRFDCKVFGMHSSDIGLVVAVVWPPKNLRSLEVTLGQKRLCTTDIETQPRPGIISLKKICIIDFYKSSCI